MNEAQSLSFTAEVKRVSSSKTTSLDKEYTLVVVSDDPTVNTLGLLPADTLIKITVEVDNG